MATTCPPSGGGGGEGVWGHVPPQEILKNKAFRVYSGGGGVTDTKKKPRYGPGLYIKPALGDVSRLLVFESAWLLLS